MALVPDALINPLPAARAALPDVLAVLESGGYGVLQLPPPGRHGLLLAVIADQVAEYAHHGYAVVAVGVRGQPTSRRKGRGSPSSWQGTICRRKSSAAGAGAHRRTGDPEDLW